MLTRAQVRELDRKAIEHYGIPALVLMENAGRGAAELLVSLGIHGPVAICCGNGNNGGDGLVMARHLDRHGISVSVHTFPQAGRKSPEFAPLQNMAWKAGIPDNLQLETDIDAFAASLRQCEWVVDALYGTGLVKPVRPPMDDFIRAINRSGTRVFAVDVPSGLDCDTGELMGTTIRAERTATFVAPKRGFAQPSAAQWLGQVHVVDIGAPRSLLAEYLST